eukprot:1082912-Pyramimonas_sp.AAC.1
MRCPALTMKYHQPSERGSLNSSNSRIHTGGPCVPRPRGAAGAAGGGAGPRNPRGAPEVHVYGVFSSSNAAQQTPGGR